MVRTLVPLKSVSQARRLYDSIVAPKQACLVAAALLLATVVLADVITGPAPLSPAQVLRTIARPASADASTWTIVWLIRLPATAMALVVGAGLGVAGAEMQTILGNPLASPYTLGISAAAGFGAALALVLGVGLVPVAAGLLVPANAFILAMLCSIAVYLIAKVKRASVETIVLTGIALHFLFSSLTALLQYMATQEELHTIVFWLFGSLAKATWGNVAVVTAVLLVAIPTFARDAWALTALRMGEAKAESLGVGVESLRRKVLLLTSVITAFATCFVGTVGFVGLVAPHIARMVVGEDQRFFLPFTLLGGSALLVVASIVSKSIIRGAVFPIGIVTSFVGIPFFLSLVLTRKGNHW